MLAGANLTIDGPLNLNNKFLTKTNNGTLTINGAGSELTPAEPPGRRDSLGSHSAPRRSGMPSPPSSSAVLDALRPIVDPDFGKSIVDLGFIKDLRIEGTCSSASP